MTTHDPFHPLPGGAPPLTLLQTFLRVLALAIGVALVVLATPLARPLQ